MSVEKDRILKAERIQRVLSLPGWVQDIKPYLESALAEAQECISDALDKCPERVTGRKVLVQSGKRRALKDFFEWIEDSIEEGRQSERTRRGPE